MKPVPHFPGYYADRNGVIYSKHPWNDGAKYRVLRPWLRDKYLAVGLYKKRKRFVVPVHQVVLVTFYGPRPKNAEACHGIKGRFDNSAKNLSWQSKSINQGHDRVRDGTDMRGEKAYWAKLNNIKVRIIRQSSDRVDPFGLTPMQLAKIFRVAKISIYSVLNRRTWKYV